MINRFKTPKGRLVDRIPGQSRLAWAMSDTEDFYDMPGWACRGGYQGSVLGFYDFETAEIYEPFEKRRNVVYGRPAFYDGFYYFLQGDFNKGVITLYKYLPKEAPEPVTVLKAGETDLYNLQLMGEKIRITSQGDLFRCYYPEQIEFCLKPNETVSLVTDEHVYVEAWFEEGWDVVNNCAADDYRYYNKVIIKDHSGNTISEELGILYQAEDGTWWIA